MTLTNFCLQCMTRVSAFNAKSDHNGFSYTEPLISLSLIALIGVIVIPAMIGKYETTQQSAKYTGYTKEAAQVLLSTYEEYSSANNGIPETMTPKGLVPYINYVKLDTSSNIDQRHGDWGRGCTVVNPCLRLHNGSVLLMQGDYTFGQKNKNHFVSWFAPDGVYNESSVGQEKSSVIDFHYDGRLVASHIKRGWG